MSTRQTRIAELNRTHFAAEADASAKVLANARALLDSLDLLLKNGDTDAFWKVHTDHPSPRQIIYEIEMLRQHILDVSKHSARVAEDQEREAKENAEAEEAQRAAEAAALAAEKAEAERIRALLAKHAAPAADS